MNNVFAILELCAFYMEYKNAKLTEISFRGRNNVKYFMQTQLLRFGKDTAKVSSLLLKTPTQHIFSLQRGRYQYCGLNLNK